MLVRLYLYKQTLRFEVCNHLFSCFVAVHACVLAAYVGADSRVVVHHGDNRQVVALTYHEVVGVVRRGDLNNAGTELHVNIVVGDYRYLAVGQRELNHFADDVLVALVVRVYSQR